MVELVWHQPACVERECALAGCCEQTLDWRFRCRGVTVNLEVKYRPHDWLRFVDSRAYGRLLNGYFRTLAGKFPVRPRGHLNVVAMTLLGSLGEELRSRAVSFLRTHTTIDAFCFWSIARRDSLARECVTQPGSTLVYELLRPADEEDRWRNPFVIHATKLDERCFDDGATALREQACTMHRLDSRNHPIPFEPRRIFGNLPVTEGGAALVGT